MTYQVPTKPIYWFLLALLLVLGAWSYFMWASYGHLPSTVETLKNEIELLKTSADSTTSTTALDLQKLEFKIERIETGIRSDFFLLQKLGLPVTVIAFALMFYSIYKSALGFALENAKKAVDKAYLSDEDIFKREKKILILTKTGGDTTFLREFVYNTGFFEAVTFPKDNLESLDGEILMHATGGRRYDMIIFNNEHMKMKSIPKNSTEEDKAKIEGDNEALKKQLNNDLTICLTKTPEPTMIFYFGPPYISPDLMSNQRVASASFKSQVYGNLINALKHQKYLLKSVKSSQA